MHRRSSEYFQIESFVACHGAERALISVELWYRTPTRGPQACDFPPDLFAESGSIDFEVLSKDRYLDPLGRIWVRAPLEGGQIAQVGACRKIPT